MACLGREQREAGDRHSCQCRDGEKAGARAEIVQAGCPSRSSSAGRGLPPRSTMTGKSPIKRPTG